ncbi:MAG TPA: hypothetical protein VFI24_08695 [Pyrinomonadaceae bacterium]|nr:hypothetical protein [Pyrinomonadaceae bacterium]
MKKLFSVIAMGCLLSLMLVGSAQAQLPGTEIRASIPFDFTVRGKTLPAGEYEITRIGDEPADLLMRNVNHKHENIVFETEPEVSRRTPRRNVLVFNRYGDSYFLEEVVTAGEQTGRELTPSHAERTLRRDMAKNEMAPETVTVALN